jgi:hypothetical protein
MPVMFVNKSTARNKNSSISIDQDANFTPRESYAHK